MKEIKNAQDAIEQAIEGDYKPPYSKINGLQTNILLIEVALTDPLFWQALGKARGWDYAPKLADGRGNEILWDVVSKTSCSVPIAPHDDKDLIPMWEHFARDWFSNRMVGGDEKTFWQSLP